MQHSTVYRERGVYGAFPILNHLPDGRLTVGFSRSTFHDHFAVGEWTVLLSTDEGGSWTESHDPAIPATWPASNPREQSDRFARIMPDGTYVCAGAVGYEVWPASRKSEAEGRNLQVREHPQGEDMILVNRPAVFVQRSIDQGKTWHRNQWDVPGFWGTGFSRSTVLQDDTILAPVYGTGPDATPRLFVWQGTERGSTWRLHPVGAPGGEAAFIETEPGRVLCLARTAGQESGGYLIQRWSDDAGATWSQALNTNVLTPGSPPHLIKLRDGRILLSHGYRREPMGIRAVFSEDGGLNWDVDNTVILRDDAGYTSELQPDGSPESDVAYPHSTQLSHGSILTVYYITPSDNVTYIGSTCWEP